MSLLNHLKNNMPVDLNRVTKKYTNGEITVIWKPGKCIHSKNCFTGLPGVFDPKKRPWINIQGDSTINIINQVNNCPSGALSYLSNSTNKENVKEPDFQDIVIEAKPNGPLFVYGNIKIKKADGTLSEKNNVTAFCRCGNSKNKPFCDGSHLEAGFKG